MIYIYLYVKLYNTLNIIIISYIINARSILKAFDIVRDNIMRYKY